MLTRQTNWSGNHEYVAERLLQPRSIEELCSCGGRGRPDPGAGLAPLVHRPGRHHGVLVALADLPVEIEVDSPARSVRVSGGRPTGSWR